MMDKWDKRFMEMANVVSTWSSCYRTGRQVGAVITKNKRILTTGYNGAPRGRKNCSDLGRCVRVQLQVPRGERYELCRSVHAEANAIIAASRENMIGSTLYMACIDPKTKEVLGGTTSCAMCKRQIINAGIETVIVRETADTYSIYAVSDWVENDDSLSSLLGY